MGPGEKHFEEKASHPHLPLALRAPVRALQAAARVPPGERPGQPDDAALGLRLPAAAAQRRLPAAARGAHGRLRPRHPALRRERALAGALQRRHRPRLGRGLPLVHGERAPAEDRRVPRHAAVPRPVRLRLRRRGPPAGDRARAPVARAARSDR